MNPEARAALDTIRETSKLMKERFGFGMDKFTESAQTLDEIITRYEEALKTILQYCPDESNCPDSHQIKSDKCVIYEHKVARDALNPAPRTEESK